MNFAFSTLSTMVMTMTMNRGLGVDFPDHWDRVKVLGLISWKTDLCYGIPKASGIFFSGGWDCIIEKTSLPSELCFCEAAQIARW